MKYNTTTPNQSPISLGKLVKGAAVVAALVGVMSCYTTVPSDSVGVLTRFGKAIEVVPPGLKLKLPFGIDHLERVEIERQLKLEFGFNTRGATNPDQVSDDPDAERMMVTGDLNMASVEWVVQYRISDPQAFLFHMREPGWTLRDMSESVMREVIGDRSVDEVLTAGRGEIESESLKRLNELTKAYGMGINVAQVQLRNVRPPESVQAAFHDVNQAQQEREQQINIARAEYNKAVPRARGEAAQRVTAAEGYAVRRVNEAKGDVAKFEAMLKEYTKAPEITRQRIYFETMKEVLPQLDRKIVVDEKATALMPLLPLYLKGDSK